MDKINWNGTGDPTLEEIAALCAFDDQTLANELIRRDDSRRRQNAIALLRRCADEIESSPTDGLGSMARILLEQLTTEIARPKK